MEIETVKLLAKYNSKANEEMNETVASLRNEEWDKTFGGYYPSVHSVCNHLYIADFNWLKRFGNIREFTCTKRPLFDATLSFASNVLDSVKHYVAMRKELDEVLLGFSEEVTAKDFEKTLKWTTSRGDDQARNFGGILLHVFNHQTHHRGMISLYLEQLGKPNDFSNLMYLV